MSDVDTQDWVFTFGCGQSYANYYHVIYGTHEFARKQMFERFGRKWSMQYASKEEAGVDEFNLKQLR